MLRLQTFACPFSRTCVLSVAVDISFKDFNGTGTLSELIFGSCVWLLSIFPDIFVQRLQWLWDSALSSFSGAVSDCCRFSATSSFKEFYGYGTLSSFSRAVSNYCRLSATSSVKEFYGYGTLSSFSGAGTTGIYNTDFENKNHVWENDVFCLPFVLVNNWKADSCRVIKLGWNNF